jgi:NADPH-dependent 2,4-dienoyl-CoA reductase/sulfur reductase-like enzyme
LGIGVALLAAHGSPGDRARQPATYGKDHGEQSVVVGAAEDVVPTLSFAGQTTADVVIIGGGIMGASMAYHLAVRGGSVIPATAR